MATLNVLGAELRQHDVLVEHLPDGTQVRHPIARIAPYPGRFVGRNGSLASLVFCADGWRCTAGDREHFHIIDTREVTP